MLNLNSVIVFSDNPSGLSGFYKKVLRKNPDWTGGEFVGFMVGTGTLIIGPHGKVHGKNESPERMMFNFEAEDVAGEFNRMKDLGAAVVAEPYHPGEEPEMWLATLADPDGNYFQLGTPMEKK